MPGENPVRAIGAELRAAAAGQQRNAAAERTRRERQPPPSRSIGSEIPARERQRVEVGNLGADAVAVEPLAAGQALNRGFGLPE